MAAAILKAMLRERRIEGIEVESAGIAAFPGQTASPNAIRVMEGRDISLEDHRAQAAETEKLLKSDLILTMTESHKTAVLSQIPNLWGKIYTLKEYAGMTDKDISDPFGLSVEEYRRTAQEIQEVLEKAIEKIVSK
jgi:protein-tyrosine-phosphatase